MNVFIFGTNDLSQVISDEWVLPANLRSFIDELISFEDTILVGDCGGINKIIQNYLAAVRYKNVTVYGSRTNQCPKCKSGYWQEKIFTNNNKAESVQQIDRDFKMVEDADVGLAIWDGKSDETFLRMFYLSLLKKPCELYLLNDERWIVINTPSDLKRYVGKPNALTNFDIRRILNYCDFSVEMVDFLAPELAKEPFLLLEIISRAPITLDKKLFIFNLMENKRNLKYEVFAFVEKNVHSGNNMKTIKHDILALAEFGGDETIWKELCDRRNTLLDAIHFIVGDFDQNIPRMLFSEWYDTDELHLKSAPMGLFYSERAIEEYIENEELDNDTDEGYYRMEAWDNYDVNWERPRYDYYYYRGKICWFEKLIPEKQEHGNTYYMPENCEFGAGSIDLDFRTPYKPGDIVLIDCRPFGPPFHAMILESRDQFDCCFPNIVFQYPGTNEWSLTPLKHRRLYKDIEWHTYEPKLSPLYRLRKISDEEITEEDVKLLDLSSIISGSEEKAGKVWDNWCSPAGDDILNWEQVLEVFALVR
ncbi:hypothetical protein [Pseudobutyrivibrio sp. MD2005]|uniref:hypothetical protein n=1 Tax=Pseudobutyrivibrio sp. MD2005 TaxID=1410616 RepID=UPI0004846A0B|nr:hypothetical protein [Pseudobutyrivibrio sp. MD2005]